MFRRGETLELHYPDCTEVETLARFQRRLVTVHRVRDLVAEPLRPDEYLHRPNLRRSRLLIYGYDIDRRGLRKFYLGTSLEYHCPETLRIALYRDGESKPCELLSREFAATQHDRAVLARSLLKLAKLDTGGYRLMVIADDLRIVG